MMRVYATLKARIMEGDFEPGSRLDPSQLKHDLSSSTTPIRDALHRLTGEGLVESWRNEGFRIRQMSETQIRDLYDWANELSHLVLRALGRQGRGAVPRVPLEDHAGEVQAGLLHLAGLSSNHEHRTAIISLSERGLVVWQAEGAVMAEGLKELQAIALAVNGGDWADASRLLDQLHRRRLRLVQAVAAHLREGRRPV